MRLKRRAFEPQQVDLLGVSLIELISGDHLEPERPDMLVRQLLDEERMSNLHGCCRVRGDQHTSEQIRDSFTTDVAEMAILQSMPVCKAGLPDLGPYNDNTVAVIEICYRKFAA
jgi:hypothetical protein